MGVAEGAKGEGSRGDDEGCAVADHGLGFIGCEKHDVADHHHGGAEDEEEDAVVEFAGEQGKEDGEEGTDDVGRDCVELYCYDGGVGVDCADDCRGEEGKALHGDVVEEEDEGCNHDDGVEDAAERLGHVELVEDFGCANAFGLDTGG